MSIGATSSDSNGAGFWGVVNTVTTVSSIDVPSIGVTPASNADIVAFVNFPAGVGDTLTNVAAIEIVS